MNEMIQGISKYFQGILSDPSVQRGFEYISSLSPEIKLTIMGVLVLLLFFVMKRSRRVEGAIDAYQMGLLHRRIEHQDVVIQDLISKYNERLTKIEGQLRFIQAVEPEIAEESTKKKRASASQ